jgi:uncharacterized membrane protein
MLILRLAISALVITLGVVLLMDGHVLIGGLLVAIATLRLVMTATMWHRRRELRARFAARRAGGAAGAWSDRGSI